MLRPTAAQPQRSHATEVQRIASGPLDAPTRQRHSAVVAGLQVGLGWLVGRWKLGLGGKLWSDGFGWDVL